MCKCRLDLQSLRNSYSFGICHLLAALVSKDSSARPSMREVLGMPLIQQSPLFLQMVGEDPAPAAGPTSEREAAHGADGHAAAAVLQRSFHRHVSRDRLVPKGFSAAMKRDVLLDR